MTVVLDLGYTALGSADTLVFAETATPIHKALGTPHRDEIHGTRGDDILRGGSGDDIIFGGPGGSDVAPTEVNGDDTLIGGPGRDQLSGGGGNDRIMGGTNVDGLFGGMGNDNMYATAGDRVANGPGTGKNPIGDRDIDHIIGDGKADRPGNSDDVFVYSFDWDRDHIDFADDRDVRVLRLDKKGASFTDGDTTVDVVWNYKHGDPHIPLGDLGWVENLVV